MRRCLPCATIDAFHVKISLSRQINHLHFRTVSMLGAAVLELRFMGVSLYRIAWLLSDLHHTSAADGQLPLLHCRAATHHVYDLMGLKECICRVPIPKRHQRAPGLCQKSQWGCSRGVWRLLAQRHCLAVVSCALRPQHPGGDAETGSMPFHCSMVDVASGISPGLTSLPSWLSAWARNPPWEWGTSAERLRVCPPSPLASGRGEVYTWQPISSKVSGFPAANVAIIRFHHGGCKGHASHSTALWAVCRTIHWIKLVASLH